MEVGGAIFVAALDVLLLLTDLLALAARLLVTGFATDTTFPIEVILLVGVAEIFTEGVFLLITVVLGAVALAAGLDALVTVGVAADLLVIRVFGAAEIVGRAGLAATVALDGADLVTVVLGAAGLAAAVLGAVCLAAAAGLDGAELALLTVCVFGPALLLPGACLCLPAAYRGEINTAIATNEIASLISILYFPTSIMNLRSVLPDLSWCKTGMINDRL